MKIATASNSLIELIKKFEGFSAKPYFCPANVPTIGYGSTRYLHGSKVKLTDAPINELQAEILLKDTLTQYENAVDSYCVDSLTQNQFDALVDFAYNCGNQNLKTSTLLKKVNANPNDLSIKLEFAKWNKGGGKILNGLVKRRAAESELYFR